MNRIQFMEELEGLLKDIPSDEREEAIRYYEDYFDDAGFFEEERVIKELGSPSKVAMQIKNNLYGKSTEEAAEYTESGYHNPHYEDTLETPANRVYNQKYDSNERRQDTKKWDRSTTLLVVGLLVLSSPIWIGLLGGGFGLVLGIMGAFFGIIVGFGATCFALLIAGGATIGMAITQFTVSPPSALVTLGVGFILLSLSFVFLAITLLIITKLIPAIIRGVVSIFRRLFQKNRRVAA